MIRTILFLAVLISPLEAFAQQSLEKVLDDYVSVVTQRKKLSDFEPEEQKYINLVGDKLNGVLDNVGKKKCIKALNEKATKARLLATTLDTLKDCATAEDFKSKCDSEYENLRRNYNRFNNATDDAQDECKS